MDWRLKALSQLVFSFVPRGEQLNYFAQRCFTHSLPVSDNSFAVTVGYARKHIDAIQQYGQRPLDRAVFYEFGTGWDLTIPFAYYGFGVNHQILVDICNLIRIAIVNDTIAKCQKMAAKLSIDRIPGARLNSEKYGFRHALKQQYGIDYRAPCNASQTGLPSQSVDYITSTSTLEHIAPAEIRSILRECRRILRDDGLMSVLIDYDDHYAYFDYRISAYNHLQFSDRTWRVFSPPLHYQNRLRHRDFVELFQSEGFRVVEDRHSAVTESDLRTIKQMSLNKRFQSYSDADLAVHNGHLVLRKYLFAHIDSMR